jgi:hypothetical protein
VKVNDKNIVISKYPEEVIKKTICGLLSSLKDVEEIKKVEIFFEI